MANNVLGLLHGTLPCPRKQKQVFVPTHDGSMLSSVNKFKAVTPHLNLGLARHLRIKRTFLWSSPPPLAAFLSLLTPILGLRPLWTSKLQPNNQKMLMSICCRANERETTPAHRRRSPRVSATVIYALLLGTRIAAFTSSSSF